MNPFRDDGHLHDLALEDVLAGAGPPEADAHVHDCATCRARGDAARAIDAEVPPLRLQAANRPARAWLAGGALVLAAAAALLVALWPGPPEPDGDGIRLRGPAISLAVHRAVDGGSEQLHDGADIAPGDRLGFSVRHADGGWLMVLGIDAAGAPYLGYPQQEGGDAVQVEPAPETRPLPEAIEMDATPGTERLVAVLCDAPFRLDPIARAVRAGDLPDGCAVAEVRVVKR